MGQPIFRRIATQCDKFISKIFQLGKSIIINKIKFIADMFKHKKVAPSNIPYIISRWSLMEPRLKFIYKYKIHPLYSFPIKEKFSYTTFDLSSGSRAKKSGDPNYTR